MSRAATALIVALSLALSPLGAARSSVVSNVVPRVDSATGEILDIHDGNTLRIGDTFYWFGASYGSCAEMSSGCATVKAGACGFNVNHTVSLATSTDLVTWSLVGVVLAVEDRPSGILFGPWVAQSKATGLYVLWFNVLPVINGSGNFDASYYSVATSARPEGPFRTVNKNVTGVAYKELPDSPSIFVDNDGAGYIAFTHEETHVNNVQQLTPDLLGPLPGGQVSPVIGGPNNEGILMFRRGALYYVFFGQCCCFCGSGTNVDAWSSSTGPLGPYIAAGSVATTADWRAQTGSVWFSGVDFVLEGDRWQSAPDKLKSHDFSYVAPLSFNADGSLRGLPGFQDNVTIQF